MSESSKCIRCGNELQAPEPGVCPACAVGATVAIHEPETLTPTPVPAPMAEGDSRAGNQVAPISVGQQLGPVRLVCQIGQGGMGVVYKGHHTILQRDVAVKVLSSIQATANDPNHAQFLHEARAAAAVRHPHLVEIHDADVAGNLPYIVMQYVSGDTLRQLVANLGPLPLQIALLLLEDIAPAIDELHRHGVVHRDIKPSNILIDGDGQAFVADFGLAVRHLQAGASPESEISGTPAYMAPEMFDGQASSRSDMYALGVTTFEMLTGTLPFEGNLAELRELHGSAALPVDRLRARGIGDDLVDVIERAAHKRSMFRYKTAGDFLRACRGAAGSAIPSAKTRSELISLLGRARQPSSPGQAEPTSRTIPATYYDMLSRIAASKRTHRPRPEPPPPPAEDEED